MTGRLTNFVLRLATAAVLAGIAAAAVWCVRFEPASAPTQPAAATAQFDSVPAAGGAGGVPSLEALATVWQRSIDAWAKHDEPEPAFDAPGPRDWPPAVELLGIAVEGDRVRAIVRAADEVTVVGAGEVVAACRVESIDARSVTLRGGGRTATLSLPEDVP